MNVITSKEERLSLIFKALGDPTRLRIFEALRCCATGVEIDEIGDCRPAGALSVGEVCCRFEQHFSTVSHHLKELRLAGLIRTEKRGRSIYCSVEPAGLELLREFLEAPTPSAPAAGPASRVPAAAECCSR